MDDQSATVSVEVSSTTAVEDIILTTKDKGAALTRVKFLSVTTDGVVHSQTIDEGPLGVTVPLGCFIMLNGAMSLHVS